MKAMLKGLAWMVFGALIAVLVVVDPLHLHPLDERLAGHAMTASEHETSASLFTCPMHPQILQDEPGSCPICGMDLVARKTGYQPAVSDESQGDLWTCPMHPQILEEEIGSCPICGMDLVRAEGGAGEAGSAAGDHGRDLVHVEPAFIQKMNVTTEPVIRRDLHREIRSVGYLDYNEQGMVSVTTRYSGFVEKVHVDHLGQPVRRGDPLFEVYSPELVQTQRELLSAKRYAESLSQAPEEVHQRARELVEAARTRLGYWALTDNQIRDIERDGVVHRTVTVLAPSSGLVMKRMHGLEGMAITPGLDVIHIADLSTLWLRISVFEDQLRWLEVNTPAEIRLAQVADRPIRGRVRFIEPEVNEETRTVSLTLEVPNSGGKLRVGMYAEVRFEPIAVRDAVAVRSQSVLRTGERNVVVLALGDGRFAPRQVRLGMEGDSGYVEVSEGLSPGDEVVTSAQFLIDSESNLQAAIDRMTAGTDHAGR
jgi:Cu(I)/Ag(I) efflux system membrane fusion protein/cobalt-zinc-cadmium efflux system membrane fusion protein